MQAQMLRVATGNALPEYENAEAFLQQFGSYSELIKENCDTAELSEHVFRTIQEIGQLASNLYRTATGQELQLRPFSALGDRCVDAYQSPKLPTRAETFGGFDERRLKQQPFLTSIANSITGHKDNHYSPHHQDKRDSYTSDAETVSLASMNTPQHHRLSQADVSNPSYEALQVSHHLHTVLCIVNQQMTTISALQQRLNEHHDNPRAKYKHNDQLEELRNKQDKFQEEKTAWQKEKEQQEKELKELREEQLARQKTLNDRESDIAEQREKLFRQLENLQKQQKQGIVTPNVGLSPSTIHCGDDGSSQAAYGGSDDHADAGSGGEKARRDTTKSGWRSASSKFQYFYAHTQYTQSMNISYIYIYEMLCIFLIRNLYTFDFNFV